MSEYLDFVKIEDKPKTQVYAVMSKQKGDWLGKIKWEPHWRHYVFYPTLMDETMHSDRCLMAISQFITKLNDKHKKDLNDKHAKIF